MRLRFWFTVLLPLCVRGGKEEPPIPFEDAGKDWFAGNVKGMIRCHKCLFSDREIRSGDVAFLMRGADSHHRYLTPLEMATNGANLPGGQIADHFYFHNSDALDRALARVCPPGDTDCEAAKGKASLEALSDDIARLQRLLQYAVASGVQRNWLRTDAWNYSLALWQESDSMLNDLIGAVQRLEAFYKQRVDDTSAWNAQAAPQFEHLLSELRAAQGARRIEIVPDRVEIPQGTASLLYHGRAVAIEQTPEYRPPSLAVDPRAISLEEVPEAERAALARVVEVWRAA